MKSKFFENGLGENVAYALAQLLPNENIVSHIYS